MQNSRPVTYNTQFVLKLAMGCVQEVKLDIPFGDIVFVTN